MAILTLSMMKLAKIMLHNARLGFFDGQVSSTHTKYFRKCTRLHFDTGTQLIFTRDVGYHTSGWFKNPDYERCYHLSLSFHDLEHGTYRAFEPELASAWCSAFYGDAVTKIWEEGWSDKSKNTPGLVESRHYRVFCNPAWLAILPRGEVYTRDFTDKHWLSWSDKQYYDRKRSGS